MTAQLAFAERYKPAREQVLDLLSDLQWHSWRELRRVGGVRYGARVGELRDEGYHVESRKSALTEDGKDYRLKWLAPGGVREPRVKVYLREQDAAAMVQDGIVPLAACHGIAEALASFRSNRGKL